MPVQSIEEWAASSIRTFPITSLRNAIIGVDALHYLDLRLNTPTSIEPLLNAIGGYPYSLKAALRDDLAAFRAIDATLVFVFDGLNYRQKETNSTTRLQESQKAHKDGWKEYYNKENGKEVAAERTLKAFAGAKYPVENLTTYFQSLLNQESVSFQVAPYSASAQLAYLERESPPTKQEDTRLIDAVVGSSELFLFNVNRIITSFNTRGGSGSFDALSRSACQERLGKVSDDVFRDVQLLLGTRFLPMFPPLDGSGAVKVSVRDALNLLNSAGRSISRLCSQFQDESVQSTDYKNNFKKAVLVIKYHIVLDKQGRATFIGPEYQAGDAHEFLGLRLPEELYFYISRGMISPRVPQWLTAGEIDLELPSGCDDSAAYRQLVGSQLTSLRVQTLRLLSDSLNRFYHSRNVTIKLWNSKGNQDMVNIKNEQPVKDKISGWKVRDVVLAPHVQGTSGSIGLAAFSEVLKHLKYPQPSAVKEDGEPLKHKTEILFNVIGRFLQLRGFVDEKHKPTVWGEALRTALGFPDSPKKLEGPVYLALEMMRFGLINAHEFVPSSTKSKGDGTTAAKTLVAQVACFGRLKHGSIGYSGPLDREMLAFQHMIDALRTSLRELLETILVTMCLNGEVDRDRVDWADIATSLPLMANNGAGLAIAVTTYLDDVSRQARKKNEGTPSEETKEEVRSNFGWLPRVPNVTKNLKNAFELWDAVLQGSKEIARRESDKKVTETVKALEEANIWLGSMR